MKKDRFISYIFYALGEIFLVVIGILIAVYFNNRNNQSKLDEIERLSMIRLAEDLSSDIDRFDFLETRLSERVGLCDSTLEIINSQSTTQDRLNIISIHLINFFLVESNTTTYDEMINTGRIYSMRDRKLRAEIINYYRQVKKWSTYIERDNEQLRLMMIQPIYNDYWSIQKTLWADKKIQFEKYPWIESLYSRELKDIETLVRWSEDTYSGNMDRISFLKRIAGELLTRLVPEETQ